MEKKGVRNFVKSFGKIKEYAVSSGTLVKCDMEIMSKGKKLGFT